MQQTFFNTISLSGQALTKEINEAKSQEDAVLLLSRNKKAPFTLSVKDRRK